MMTLRYFLLVKAILPNVGIRPDIWGGPAVTKSCAKAAAWAKALSRLTFSLWITGCTRRLAAL
jgi:hypothetical protein